MPPFSKRGFLGTLFFGAVLVTLFYRTDFAVEIVPASMHDILNALGPDGQGLGLTQENLPDLFALTASRIEENPTKFIVEQPYQSGRWQGGKAVIEYARDLSYTLVSVYDKQGQRQRIYSVRTNFTEHVAGRPAPGTPDLEVVSEETTPSPPAASQKRGAASSAAASTASSNVRYEWDEAKATYVPVPGSGSTEATEEVPVTDVTTKASPKETTPAPAPSSQHRKHRHPAETTATTSRTTSNASAASASGSAQDSGIWLAATPKTSKPAAAEVRVANTTWVEKSSEETPPPKKRHKHPKPKPAPSTETPAVASGKTSESKTGEEWVPKSMQEPSKHSAAQEVPSTEELLANAPPPSSPKSQDAVPVATEKPSRKNHPKAAAAEESAPAAVSAPVHTTEPPIASAHKQEAVPSTEDLLASADTKTGPDTSEGDKWTPKPTPKQAVVEPELPKETVQVANIPKPAPVDNSVDNLLKMAGQESGGMPKESDNWVPKKTVASQSEADINKELERIREQEKKQAAPKPVVKIKHDINNPEEGVLPVSSFEKFSGPLYGRHREYERRFFPGKKSKTGVPDHDFYVEEVDRKKEIHNIYFYKHEKGKAPKLVAVERHERVSFLGNYDIEKEDKGKISTYN